MSFFSPGFIVPMNQKTFTHLKGVYNERGYDSDPAVKLKEKQDYGFGNVFKAAVQDVIDTDKDYVNKQYLLATGQIDNAADVSIAASKAQLAVDLLVQMRNSALTAYNEILRINV